MKTIEELNRTAREFEKSEADSAIKLRREAHQRKIIKGLQAKVEELEGEKKELISSLGHITTCLSILRNEKDIKEIPRLVGVLKDYVDQALKGDE